MGRARIHLMCRVAELRRGTMGAEEQHKTVDFTHLLPAHHKSLAFLSPPFSPQCQMLLYLAISPTEVALLNLLLPS
jgi:hypothetical protein